MLEKFLPRIEFDSYEDFKKNYKVNVPDGFNFAYDIIDAWAKQDKTTNALLYCTDDGTRRMYTFEELRLLSNKAANFFVANGITNGLSATEFGVNTVCNRAQIVTFLHRAFA